VNYEFHFLFARGFVALECRPRPPPRTSTPKSKLPEPFEQSELHRRGARAHEAQSDFDALTAALTAELEPALANTKRSSSNK
jgi:hypothetical protein